jgi:hypothetical protein
MGSHSTDLRFQGPNFGAGHFKIYWLSPMETQRVQYRLTNCEEIWNFFLYISLKQIGKNVFQK